MSLGFGVAAAPALGVPVGPPPTLGVVGVPAPPAGVTWRTPFIHEWREQWNWYVPGLSFSTPRTGPDAPVPSRSLPNSPSWPSRSFLAMLSRLVKVRWSPWPIVIVAVA